MERVFDKTGHHDLSTNPNDIPNEPEVNNESSRSGANDCGPAPGIANNDVKTSASIVLQDIVNMDDSTTDNILQPQSIQQNSDDNVEAEFPMADDESSKSSVAETPPTKKPLGQAIERRRKKKLSSLFTDKYTNKENTVPSKANHMDAIDKSKKCKAVGRLLPIMESRLSKPPNECGR